MSDAEVEWTAVPRIDVGEGRCDRHGPRDHELDNWEYVIQEEGSDSCDSGDLCSPDSRHRPKISSATLSSTESELRKPPKDTVRQKAEITTDPPVADTPVAASLQPGTEQGCPRIEILVGYAKTTTHDAFVKCKSVVAKLCRIDSDSESQILGATVVTLMIALTAAIMVLCSAASMFQGSVVSSPPVLEAGTVSYGIENEENLNDTDSEPPIDFDWSSDVDFDLDRSSDVNLDASLWGDGHQNYLIDSPRADPSRTFGLDHGDGINFRSPETEYNAMYYPWSDHEADNDETHDDEDPWDELTEEEQEVARSVVCVNVV